MARRITGIVVVLAALSLVGLYISRYLNSDRDVVKEALTEESLNEQRHVEVVKEALTEESLNEQRHVDVVKEALTEESLNEQRHVDVVKEALTEESLNEQRHVEVVKEALTEESLNEQRHVDVVKEALTEESLNEQRHVEVVKEALTEESLNEQRHVDVVKEALTEESLNEQRHVVYVRIPKTGSSTMTSLLWRFAWTRMLKVLASKPKCAGTLTHVFKECFFLESNWSKFDIMAEHVFFDKVSYKRFFHDDTVYVTLLRQPLSMLQSSVYYLDAFAAQLKGDNKVETYLRNPGSYDNISMRAGRSYTRNPQSSYFGLKKQHFNKVLKIQELISDIESNFPVVMILEKWDESLILLRRALKWPMKDVIYHIKNRNEKNTRLSVSDKGREKYRQWSLADHMLYEHFGAKLDKEIALGGKNFQTELALFKKYKENVSGYCFNSIADEDLYFPKTEHHDAFTVTRQDCALIHVLAPVLISSIKKRQFSVP